MSDFAQMELERSLDPFVWTEELYAERKRERDEKRLETKRGRSRAVIRVVILRMPVTWRRFA